MKLNYTIALVMLAALVGYGAGNVITKGEIAGSQYLAAQDKLADGMAGHDMGHEMSPWAQAYDDANSAMHAGMMIDYSDNADLDFARSMIAHHQGAIDMAKIELQHGKDPEMRKLAQAMIAAQEAEITQMQAWVAKP
jgi:uncharacterized protein (DUF305 family)